MNPPRLCALAPALVVACVAACAAPRGATPATLPYHVALIPLHDGTPPGTSSAATGDLDLHLRAAGVTSGLIAELEAGCFTRATLLDLPEGLSGAEFEAWPAEQRDAHWIAAAQAVRADVLLEGELKYDPVLRGSRNEKFWLNLPLFALGGPLCYFVDDRSYAANARLLAALHDLNPILEGRASLADGRSRLVDVTPRFEGTDLDFRSRNGGNASRYLASLVVPAGFLARSGERVERRVAREIESDLAARLAQELSEAAQQAGRAEHVASFHLESLPTLEREGDALRVRASILLRRGDLERLDSWRLEHGGQVAEGFFDDPGPAPELCTRRETFVRHVLDARLPRDPAASVVRLELVAGGREPVMRTFTLSAP